MHLQHKSPNASSAIAALDLSAHAPESARAELQRAIEHVPARGVLEARVCFDPSSCITLINDRDLRARVAWQTRREWGIEIQRPDAPAIMDLRDLEAPEPLKRILEASALLTPGETLMARTPRYPRALLPQLDERGLDWKAIEEPDQSALVWVGRPG